MAMIRWRPSRPAATRTSLPWASSMATRSGGIGLPIQAASSGRRAMIRPSRSVTVIAVSA
ncbi:hypothetical protein SR39_06945 [Methylobacterium radiotolerans]|nr:hypothetical protein SR39_06945 [Methylobacterium radiotolerans]